jgi:hypothetical protein
MCRAPSLPNGGEGVCLSVRAVAARRGLVKALQSSGVL